MQKSFGHPRSLGQNWLTRFLTTDQKVGGSSPSKRTSEQASKLLACKPLSDSSQLAHTCLVDTPIDTRNPENSSSGSPAEDLIAVCRDTGVLIFDMQSSPGISKTQPESADVLPYPEENINARNHRNRTDDSPGSGSFPEDLSVDNAQASSVPIGETIQIGRARRVTLKALRQYIANLERQVRTNQ